MIGRLLRDPLAWWWAAVSTFWAQLDWDTHWLLLRLVYSIAFFVCAQAFFSRVWLAR